MRTNTPEPRLPLEPEEYPLYRPPRRIGCSALAVLPLVLIAVFAFLFWRITPQVAEGIIAIPRQILNVPTYTPTPDIEITPGAGGLATQTVPVTATVAVTATAAAVVVVTPTGTPVLAYFKVGGTGGIGVKLRAQPQQNADRVAGLDDGTVVKMIGPDQKNADGNWKHVSSLDEQYSGWINANYLSPTTKP